MESQKKNKRKTNEKRLRDGKRSGAADNRRTRKTNTDKDAAHAGTKYPPADNLKEKDEKNNRKRKKMDDNLKVIRGNNKKTKNISVPFFLFPDVSGQTNQPLSMVNPLDMTSRGQTEPMR